MRRFVCLENRSASFARFVPFALPKDPESLPERESGKKLRKKIEIHFLALKEGRILLQQNLGKRWHGLWSLPALAPNLNRVRTFDVDLPFLSLSYPITRFVVRLNVFLSEPPATVLNPGQAWHRLELLDSVPMPSPIDARFEWRQNAVGLSAARG